ncbi:MAG: outer membrane protein [Caulobacteraceae bacterium]
MHQGRPVGPSSPGRRLIAALALGVAASLIGGSGAAAQTGWYLSGSGGALLRQDSVSVDVRFQKTILLPGPPPTSATIHTLASQRLSYDPGAVGNLALGYRLSGHLRAEAEIGYAAYDVSALQAFSPDPRFSGLKNQVFQRSSGAEVQRLTGTLNAFYDFNPIGRLVTPYVGFGGGIADFHRSAGVFTNGAVGSLTQAKGDWTAFAAFVEAGAAVRLSRRWSLVPAYRFSKISFRDDGELAHIFKVGARYAF